MGRFQWLERDDGGNKPSPPATAFAPSTNDLSLTFQSQAQSFLSEGHYSKALREYSRVLTEDSSNLDSWTYQTVCQLALHEYDQAVVWARKFVQRFPSEPQALSILALALSHAPGGASEAESILSRLEAVGTKSFNHAMRFAAAFAQLALGRHEASQKSMAELLESLRTVQEQVFWVDLSAAFYLDRRCADNACLLLETMDSNGTLTVYGLSLWIKAEWLRGGTAKAKRLRKRLRQCDLGAVTAYGVNEYMDSVQPQDIGGVGQYIMDLFNRLT